MPTDKTISRGLFPQGALIIFCAMHISSFIPIYQNKKYVNTYCASLILGGDKILMPTDKSISRGLFSREAPFFFVLCTSPPLYQSIKTKSRSIPFALPRFLVGTKFECRQTKASPEGYYYAKRQFFSRSAHLLLHTNLLKKEVGQYLLRFLNFGWGQNLNANRQNSFKHCESPHSYQSIRIRSNSIMLFTYYLLGFLNFG